MTTPAWTDSDLSLNPHAAEDKPRRVREMFSAIAKSYDLNNRLHSFGRDQAWRKKAVKAAGLKPGDRVLDVACGTGDLSLAFAKALTQVGGPAKTALAEKQVVGVDFTPAMLELAKVKAGKTLDQRPLDSAIAEQGAKLEVQAPEAQPQEAESQAAQASQMGPQGGQAIDWQVGDAMDLKLPDASFDVVSIAFGIRNVNQPDKALAEFYRVLKPGGRLVVLEFSEPRHPIMRWGNRMYCHHIMPWTATWISRDQSGAYKYLPKSVDTFWSRPQMEKAIAQAGFGHVHHQALTFGVAVVYVGRKP